MKDEIMDTTQTSEAVEEQSAAALLVADPTLYDGPSPDARASVPPPKGVAKRKLRRTKKPQEMPSRPLSAYNLFFREARIDWLAEADQIAALEQEEELASASVMEVPSNPDGTRKRKKSRLFEKMAKEIGRRWKGLTPTRKRKYEELAEQDKERYRQDMNLYQEQLVSGTTADSGTNTKAKKLKKSLFTQDAQQNAAFDTKPYARSIPLTNRNAEYDFLSASHANTSSTIMPPPHQSSGSFSGQSSRASSMNASAPTAASLSAGASALQLQAMAALENQNRNDELRLMAATAFRRQQPDTPAVDWNQLLGVSGLLPPADLQSFLQEQQRLAYSNTQGQNAASIDQQFTSLFGVHDQQRLANQFGGNETSNFLRLLVQQELERRTPMVPQQASLAESSIRNQQLGAAMMSQEYQQRFQGQGHVFQNSDNSSSLTRTVQEQQELPHRHHSTTSNPGYLGNISESMLHSLGSAGPGHSTHHQHEQTSANAPNPYETMALYAYLQEQNSRNQGQQEEDRDRA